MTVFVILFLVAVAAYPGAKAIHKDVWLWLYARRSARNHRRSAEVWRRYVEEHPAQYAADSLQKEN
jgi:hypothetical protein